MLNTTQTQTKDKEVQLFLTNNPGFDLVNGNLDFVSLNWGSEDKAVCINRLKAYQRLLKIEPDMAAADALLECGYDSANKITLNSLNNFIADVTPHMGVDGDVKAKAIYRKASNVMAKVQHLCANIKQQHSPYYQTMVNKSKAVDSNIKAANGGQLDVNNLHRDLPGYEEIFGSIDYIHCDENKSIFGPAAYLVDLLRVIDKYITEENNIDEDWSFDERRPDIAGIALSDQKTNTMVPYLQIANEVLMRQSGIKELIPDPNEKDLEKATRERELVFATENFSLVLPFNIPLQKIRFLLKEKGVRLSDIFEAYTNDSMPGIDACREYLNISPEEMDAMLNGSPDFSEEELNYLCQLNKFVMKTGLSKEEVHFLFYQDLTDDEVKKGIAESFYINAGSGCIEIDGNEFIQGLTAGKMKRINCFLRLAKKTGWDFKELNWVLRSIGCNTVSRENINEILIKIAKIKKLIDEKQWDINFVTSLWYSLKTIGRGDENSPGLFDAASYHPKKQVVAGIDGDCPYYLSELYVDEHVTWNLKGNVPMQSTAEESVPEQTDTGKKADSIIACIPSPLNDIKFISLALFKEDKIDLSVENLSAIYRHVMLAQKLGISSINYIVLLKLLGKPDEKNKYHTLDADDVLLMIETVKWLKESGISLFDINYICNGAKSVYADKCYDEEKVGALLKSLVVYLKSSEYSQLLENPELQRLSDDETFKFFEDRQKAQRNKFLDHFTDKIAVFLNIPADAASILITNAVNKKLMDDKGTQATEEDVDMFWAGFISKTISSPDTAELLNLLGKMTRVMKLKNVLSLNLEELNCIIDTPGIFGITKDSLSLTLYNIKSIYHYKKLVNELEDKNNYVLKYLKLNEEISSKKEVAEETNPETKNILELTQWKAYQMEQVISTLLGSGRSKCSTAAELMKVKRIFDLAKAVQCDIYFLEKLNDLRTMKTIRKSVDPKQYEQASKLWEDFEQLADILSKQLKANMSVACWESVYKRLTSSIEEQKRNALVNLVLDNLKDRFPQNRPVSSRDLYEYLLIDMDMGGATEVSYIKQAICSAQLYLQRCRLHLEGEATVDIPEIWWQWLMNYRVWEANRKVFLYPENYIDPALRKSKTTLFKQLESELRQGELTADKVETAFLNYLDQFEKLAKLQYIEGYYCTVKSEEKGAVKTLFLFARTKTEPYEHYCISGECIDTPDGRHINWSEWQKIDTYISSEYITPVYAFNKLFVFWVEFKEHKEQKDNSSKSNIAKASIKYTFQNFSQKWSQPQTLLEDHVVNAAITGAEKDTFWKKVSVSVTNPGDCMKEKISIQYGSLIINDLKNVPASGGTLSTNSMNKTVTDTEIMKDGNGRFTLSRWVELPHGPEWSDYSGWNQECFYETIQFADINGDGKAELIGRGANGIQAWEYGKEDGWKMLKVNYDLGNGTADSPSWEKPEYYKTIQLADIDNDGRAELIGRYKDGIHLWRYKEDGSGWERLATNTELGDAKNPATDIYWEKPQHYETIQCVDIDGDGKCELLARCRSGLFIWRYTKENDSWTSKLYDDSLYIMLRQKNPKQSFPSGIRLFDGDDWDKPCYYKTIQCGYVENDNFTGHKKYRLLARTPFGMLVAKYTEQKPEKLTEANLCNGSIVKWEWNCGYLTSFRDDKGFTEKSHYDIIRLADVDGDGKDEIIARCKDGINVWKFKPDSKKEWKKICDGPDEFKSEDAWKDPSCYETIQLADIDGDGKAELLARTKEGIFAWKFDGSSNWIKLLKGPALSDREGWDNPCYYKNIHLADIDGDGKAELIVRTKYGVRAWKYCSVPLIKPVRPSNFSFVMKLQNIALYTNNIVKNDIKEPLKVLTINGLDMYAGGYSLLAHLETQNTSVFSVENNAGMNIITVNGVTYLLDSDSITDNNLPDEEWKYSSSADICGPHFSVKFHTENELKIKASRLTTNAIEPLSDRIFTGGIKKLLSIESQEQPDGQQEDKGRSFSKLYPSSNVSIKDADPDIDNDYSETVSFYGPYGNYYWELFFHAPFMVANILSADQKFEEAQKWYQYIFNPTNPAYKADGSKSYWHFRLFRNRKPEALLDLLKNTGEIYEYNNEPFDPHAIARLRSGAYEKTVVMKYIDNLLNWGDYEFSKYTWESLTSATMLYVYAYDLLGERPQKLGNFDNNSSITFNDIHYNYIKFQEHDIKESFYEKLIDENANDRALAYIGDNIFSNKKYQTLKSNWIEKDLIEAMNTLILTDEDFHKNVPEILSISDKYAEVKKLLNKESRTERETRKLNALLLEKRYSGDISISYIPQFYIELENKINSSGNDEAIGGICNKAYNYFDAHFGIPENDQFIAYWDRIEDRLFKIRHGLNLKGQGQLMSIFESPIDSEMLVKAAAASNSSVIDLADGLQAFNPSFRFSYMLERAKNIASTVVQLGSSLLLALEKNDAEALSLLRSSYEKNILDMTTMIKQKQIDDIQAQIDGISQNLNGANYRLEYYSNLINEGLNLNESEHLMLLEVAFGLHVITEAITLTSIAGYLAPNIFGLADGGMQFGDAIDATSKAANIVADGLREAASLHAITGQNERREQEWNLQKESIVYEINRLNKEMESMKLRHIIGQQDLAIHLKSIERTKAEEDFLRSKFSNQDLYQWMIGRISEVYFQTYKLAVDMAKAAQTAYWFELDRDDKFINLSCWDSLRKGLLAGEALTFSLNQMEKAYIENNVRRLEIEKTISIKNLFRDKFNQFTGNLQSANSKSKGIGVLEFDLSEKLFDDDFSRHYCRKIKSVSISIPAIVGPYQNINATLVQTSNQVRIKQGEDPETLITYWCPCQQIAISKGVDESGMFVLDFRDERYLPFEGTGAISSWRLSMPEDKNPNINYKAISDIIFKIQYTALDTGSNQTRR